MSRGEELLDRHRAAQAAEEAIRLRLVCPSPTSSGSSTLAKRDGKLGPVDDAELHTLERKLKVMHQVAMEAENAGGQQMTYRHESAAVRP